MINWEKTWGANERDLTQSYGFSSINSTFKTRLNIENEMDG